jgi:hypothetical protein
MTRRLQIVVDVALDATPISGHVSTDEHAPRPFQGWLELASAIERLRSRAAAGEDLAINDELKEHR